MCLLLILTIAKADDSSHPPAAFARWITARRMHHISWQKADLDDDKECSPAVDINAASNWRSFGTSRCGSQKNLHRFALRPKGGWRPFMAQTASSPQRGVMPAIEAKAAGRRTWPPPPHLTRTRLVHSGSNPDYFAYRVWKGSGEQFHSCG
jgi:hypothetical protein